MEQKYARNKYAIYYDSTKKVPNILNQQVKILRLGRLPGLLIVDKQGIVQYAYYGDSMSDIPSNEEVLEVLKTINSK